VIKEVTEFNIKRNQLAFDLNLELKMVQEEIREFWDATTTAERLDALIDTEYVWIGTQVKASYNTKALPDELVNGMRQTMGLMGDYLAEELGMHMSSCYYEARKIVCEINATKGTAKDADGKVMKKKDIRDATKEIAIMIEEIKNGKL